MSPAEISGGVMHEFEQIVQSHTKHHHQEKWAKIIGLCALGSMVHSVIDSALIVFPVLLALTFYGVKVLFTKPDLNQGISAEEIEQLSDDACSAFSRLGKKWGRAVLLSDLDSVVRTASKRHKDSMKARERAESDLRMREQQERALYARRKKKDD